MMATRSILARRLAAMPLRVGAWLLAVGLLSACSVIDDALDDCGGEYRMDYQLRLVTNMTTELQTVLNTEGDEPLRTALSNELQAIFTDYARDVDLSFYGTDSLRHVHEDHEMNANEASYTIFLPIEEYMHLALANVNEQRQVVVTGADDCATSFLSQTASTTPTEWERDHIRTTAIGDSHEIGLFTARQSMHVLGTEDQTFDVRLFMTNAAAALVVDTAGHAVADMHVYVSDLADGFLVRDSAYSFRWQPLVRMFPVPLGTQPSRAAAAATTACYCGVGFPSRDVPLEGQDGAYWRLRAYVTLPDGTVTENVLSVQHPLPAGHLKIIRCRLGDNGTLLTDTPEVGVSVTLDWKPGGTYRPEI